MNFLNRCEMEVRKLANCFVHDVKTGHYSPVTVATQYEYLVNYCRDVYGFCPNEYGKLYDRLPTVYQLKINEMYERGDIFR